MKPRTGHFFALLLAGTCILQPQSEAEAQLFVGAHGSVNDLGGTAWGLGGRLGVGLYESRDLTVVLEGVGEYLWPPCDLVDCGAVLLHANILARRGISSYAEVYAGLGFVYENLTIEDGTEEYDGDDVGFSIVAGSQSGQPGGIRPFIEVRYTWMDQLENQAGAAIGLRVPVG